MAKNQRDIIPTTDFTVTDWDSDYALDCDTDNANAIADVLGTLIKELIAL